jgi:predicted dehydrogenase
MSKIRVGVVGVGYLGKFHAEKYARMPEVELVGIADTDAGRLRRIAAELGAEYHGDHRRLFGKVDAVSIAAPTGCHFPIGRDFLEQGIDVLIEKPIAARLDEADALIALAQARGRILQVGHLERFNPAVTALRDVLAGPMFIESQRLSTFRNRCTDVSVVLDLMIHDIDIISSLVGSEVRSIRAVGAAVVTPQVDVANARLEFHNGCVASVAASRVAFQNERRLRLYQKDAAISIDFLSRSISILRPSACGHSAGGDPAAVVEERTFAAADALAEELKDFVTAIRRRSKPTVSGLEGRKALEIALDIMARIDSNPC